MAEFTNCGGCSAAVVNELVWMLVNVLNCCDDSWRDAMQGRLLDLLDLQDA